MIKEFVCLGQGDFSSLSRRKGVLTKDEGLLLLPKEVTSLSAAPAGRGYGIRFLSENSVPSQPLQASLKTCG